MSISAFGVITYRPFRAYDDPGLPAGTWLAVGSVTGDGSGGNRQIVIDISLAANPLDSRFYSLEQYSFGDTVNADNDVVVGINGFDNTPIGNKIAGFVDRVEASQALSRQAPGGLSRGLFIGQQGVVGTGTDITTLIANSSGALFVVSFEGYFWTPRSILAPNGGLRRPIEGLYA